MAKALGETSSKWRQVTHRLLRAGAELDLGGCLKVTGSRHSPAARRSSAHGRTIVHTAVCIRAAVAKRCTFVKHGCHLRRYIRIIRRPPRVNAAGARALLLGMDLLQMEFRAAQQCLSRPDFTTGVASRRREYCHSDGTPPLFYPY